ncbi:CRP-like cAMP-binding protein [Nocardiopsis mwathae]|uniref:CRP-like cAMP-binding protein n=1 Tax=Nocardiopsis mwathae TaxID=1472723 RepID=A0A7W9YIK5_9ACTN|nr:Crp/Fnr family transcriptional regulator [Nocardiopsis mwathae]MBB6172839.1 CRP-like cAMP-binding protein [Nocardiopsis mwathae]
MSAEGLRDYVFGPGFFWDVLRTSEVPMAHLFSHGVGRSFAPGEDVARQGEPVRRVFVVHSGYLKVFARSRDGEEILSAIFGPRDLVGAASSALRPPTWRHTVRAAGEVRVTAIPRRYFRIFLLDHPRVALELNGYIAHLLSDSDQRFLDMSTRGIEARLSRLLATLAERFGYEVDGGTEIAAPMTQKELASFIGASEVSVSRALQQLRRDGVVETGYRRLLVRDLPALEAGTVAVGRDSDRGSDADGAHGSGRRRREAALEQGQVRRQARGAAR